MKQNETEPTMKQNKQDNTDTHTPARPLYKWNERMSIKQATHAHHKCWLDTTDSKST